jgi:hypothetical protein
MRQDDYAEFFILVLRLAVKCIEMNVILLNAIMVIVAAFLPLLGKIMYHQGFD